MATMISEAYDAFIAAGAPEEKAIAAGAPEEKARKAAEARANYDQRFDRVEREMLKIQAELTLLKWMVGVAVALDVAILLRVFVH